MNYEELLDQLQQTAKGMKDAATSVTKQQKTLVKNEDLGNLAEVRKGVAAIRDQAEALLRSVEQTEALIDGFDTQAYFVSGDFTRQLLDSCEEKGVDVVGEKGVYQMFPYKIRVLADEDHAGEVWMDRKKVNTVRPAYLAETIRAGREKLYRAKFDVQSFITELADAYETTWLRTKGGRDGSTIDLSKIYKYLAPTARARKEYDNQAFAFDLARAYEAGPDAWVTKTGEKYYLGPSRNNSGYRVLSSTGVESYISTLRHMVNAE